MIMTGSSIITITSDFFPLLRSAVFMDSYDLSGEKWTHGQVVEVCDLARKQAAEGLIIKGIFDSGLKLDRPDLIDLVGKRQSIWQGNLELDQAVADLCSSLHDAGIRIWVVKGQTLAQLYPEPKSRSCGDIDFLCHPDDWEKAVAYFTKEHNVVFINPITPKDEGFSIKGIKYEMHRTLVMLSSPSHQRYWDTVVMDEILASDESIEICGVRVPVLPPTINALYVFAHIFGHFISEGIGLRQFCDWALVLKHYKPRIDVAQLEAHLEGIGLKKAFIGFGAILTDYLGLPYEDFPFEIPQEFHRRAGSLWKNILELGNFGKNKKYLRSSGPIHGLQHLWRIAGQAIKFHYYAPSESWWKIPRMFMWWGEKIKRIAGSK